MTVCITNVIHKMRLILNNFGVWTDKTFEFPDTGLTLVTGPSGKGKTTIFRAINYALTGTGTKLPTLGEKRCTVTFEYKDMTITRTNTPCRVVVITGGVQYEGDEAQSIIYQNIGKNFEIAGYIHQKGENSFLGMTPSDKLRFLEKVAFSDVNIDEIKEKAKDLVSNSEIVLSTVQGELKYLKENPITQPEEFGYTKREISVLLKSVTALIATLTSDKDRLEKEKLQQFLLKEKKTGLVKRISDITFDTVPDALISEGEESILKDWKAYEVYQQEKKSITELEGYIKKNQDEINKLTDILEGLSIVTDEEKKDVVHEIEELSEFLVTYKRQQDRKALENSFSTDRYDTLVTEIPTLQEQLRVLVQSKEARVCPGCRIHLRVLKDTLEVFPTSGVSGTGGSKYSIEKEKELSNKIAVLKKELTTLEVIKRQLDSLPADTEEIELDPEEVKQAVVELKNTQAQHEKAHKQHSECTRDLQKLGNNDSVSKMKERVALFSASVEPPKPGKSKSELEKRINEIVARARDISRITKDNETKKVKKQQLEKELESLPEGKDIACITEELLKITEGLSDAHKQQLQYKELEQKAIQYEKSEKSYLAFVESEKRVRETLLEAERKFTLAKKFRDTVHTAEMLALNGLIEEINSHLSLYLSVFFPDNPITLDLCLFKANEKTKLVRNQINIQVGYRGAVTDLSTLSGGEKDRVNLAFTLALAEIFQIPMMMLDETLSSLDRESTENILEHIQKDSRGILVVAHQVSPGLFDHVYTV
jgi:DNA repair exonuclease SbcCD ATPase subunit